MPDLPQLRDAIAAAKETLGALSSLEPQMAQAAGVVDQCVCGENKVLVCGNGGSAADASHFATELVVRFAKDRRALPAICRPPAFAEASARQAGRRLQII